MGNAVQKNILHRIKAAKYFAVILDCTPDISHQEQMSMTIRYVSDGAFPNTPAGVYEHFITFLDVKSSTGENLFNVLKKELETLGLDLNNIRGQGYDNGANMRGKESGVQARLLQENPRAFFTSCACHNYNLVLGDMAKTCPDAMTFFGTLQRLYVLFSASTKRWAVFQKHVTGLSVKPLCETRWECRMQSVKAVRYQAGNFYDALVEIAETSDDAQARSEAESLAHQIKHYKFLVSLVLWHDLLFQVNFVSKELQSNTVDLATGIASFEKLLDWLKNYRVTGFEQVLVGANELANELEVAQEFQIQRLRKRKRHFNYESADDLITDPKKAYQVNCFNQVLDKAMQSLEPRFKQLKKHIDLFGFLSKFQEMSKEELKKHAAALEIALTHVQLIEENKLVRSVKLTDLEGHMLVEEMDTLKPILPSSLFGKPLKILEFLSLNERATAFPNFFIALRIFLTIPVTVASGERSFSKLKLIKTYLRSNMLQERLNSLALLSIECEEAKNLNFDSILKEFAERKARRVSI
ncbi:zinc finger MYM-type protein 1 [Xenopus laevis]|uniref:Zinc finger MYM-type protein 1 n=1 Tax=Xenopus laevis TaxID=8355 RepID=A0A8J0U318_XENLA|nr:zinc finger MYM-type protein 1 [Xenopus laevis]